MPTPGVPFLKFRSHFTKFFEGNAALGINPEIAAKLSQIEDMPFTPNEIQFVVGQMKSGKSSEFATFCIEHLLNHKDGNL